VLAAVLAVPARGGEVDPYLPEDTEVLVNLNVRQVLDSPVVKKNALDKAREALKGLDQVVEILDDLGFDPFTDLDRVLIASPGGGEQDQGLVIARGHYNLAKFKTRGETASRDNADVLKIHKVADGLGGQHLVYEVAVNGPDQETPLFVALADKNTLLASPGKDYVVDALKKASLKHKPNLKDKDFQALLEKMDERQSLSLAAVGSALRKGGLGEGPAKELLDKVDAIGGGIPLADDLHVEVVLSARTVEGATQVKEAADRGIKQVVTLAALASAARPELAPLFEVARTLKVSARGKLLTLKGHVSAEVLEETFKKDE